MLLLTSSSSRVRLNGMNNVSSLLSALPFTSLHSRKQDPDPAAADLGAGGKNTAMLQPAGWADVEGGKGERVWKMLHGCPQFSGLSFTKYIAVVRCWSRRLRPFQRAACRCPRDEKPGGESDSGF